MTDNKCMIGNVEFGGDKLSIIAGPCMAESLDICMAVAKEMKSICDEMGIGYVFKASFDKANRSSVSSYRGPGIDAGLEMLAAVAEETALPVITDIHEPFHAKIAAEVVDALQIPAFLARQTDLLVAAGETGKAVNVKKGQFMAPWDMANVVDKLRSTGNKNIMLTDRGTFFGYNRLVTDMRCIQQMQEYGPVTFDATHSVQQPGGLGNASGGERQFAGVLACSAIAAGANGLFIETHPDPNNAKSDASCQIALADMPAVLKRCKDTFEVIQNNPY